MQIVTDLEEYRENFLFWHHLNMFSAKKRTHPNINNECGVYAYYANKLPRHTSPYGCVCEQAEMAK